MKSPGNSNAQTPPRHSACIAQLAAQNPHQIAAPLEVLINCLMTELWDRNFSQSDIRTAFEDAVSDMPRYAAGEERRSPASAQLATVDWRRATEKP